MRHEIVSPTVQRLLDGRERVARGWCQKLSTGNPNDGSPTQYCALAAVSNEVYPYSVNEDIVLLLQRSLPKGFRSVMVYNDLPTTTQKDIIALYDRAIELALGNTRGNSVVDRLKEFCHVS